MVLDVYTGRTSHPDDPTLTFIWVRWINFYAPKEPSLGPPWTRTLGYVR